MLSWACWPTFWKSRRLAGSKMSVCVKQGLYWQWCRSVFQKGLEIKCNLGKSRHEWVFSINVGVLTNTTSIKISEYPDHNLLMKRDLLNYFQRLNTPCTIALLNKMSFNYRHVFFFFFFYPSEVLKSFLCACKARQVSLLGIFLDWYRDWTLNLINGSARSFPPYLLHFSYGVTIRLAFLSIQL